MVRTPKEGRPSRDGMTIQIIDDYSSQFSSIPSYARTGAIWGVAPAKQDHLKLPGEWNTAEVVCNRRNVRVTRDGDRLIVQGPGGDITFVEQPRFVLPGLEETAGGFVAKMPGKVIELRVQVGDRVTTGDTVLALEAMKMEHPMHATEDGVVTEVHVAQGEQVEVGTLLLVVEPDAVDTAADGS